MKKLIAWVLLVCMLAAMAGCGDKPEPGREPEQDEGRKEQQTASRYEPGIVAQPLGDEYREIPVDALQDLRYWAEDDTELRNEPSEMDDKQVYDYTSEMDIVEEYVAMLRRNGWTQVDYEEGYKGGTRSWGLTCDAAPGAEKIKQMFTDTPCHLSIHWTDSEHYRVFFYISEDIQVRDLGLRQEGSSVDAGPVGASACAGLERLKDGSYRTSDGRLTAFPGSAMGLRDGQEYVVDVDYENDGQYERIRTEHYYRDEGLKLTFPEDSLMDGDFFQLWDLDIYKAYWEADGKSAGTSLKDYLQVYIAHEDKWTCPGRNDDDYEALTVRVMYRDKGGDMVIYVCGRFDDDEPREIEALVAVDTSLAQGEVQDVTYLQVGDKITLRYHPPKDSESYVLYTWQILEGDENIWIDGGETTCEVRALDAGSAVIRVTYEYTEEGYDVLTGDPENQPRAATQDYYFIIE